MNRLYHRSQVSMEVTKVTLDAGDEDQILIQCWQGGNTYHTIYLYPQEGKKFELFNGIEFKDETFKGNHAIYTKDDNIIILTGDVSIESPTRLLTGYELIADIDNNKRILNSADKDSLVEVLLENDSNN